MALDEALLEAMPRLGRPVLRFYGWTDPAASFGYFQHYADVAGATFLRPLVRRPTGGGLVAHDADWTYSLAFPADHEWYSLNAEGSYRWTHEWLRGAFARIGVATELAPCCHRTGQGQCFLGYEKSDLLWQGRKIAGAAQRRTRNGLLLQGSVQPSALSLRREEWEHAMRDMACAILGADWRVFRPDPLVFERARALALAKYSRAGYNQKR